MIQDIFVGMLCAIMVGAGALGWWIDNTGKKKDEKERDNICEAEEYKDER